MTKRHFFIAALFGLLLQPFGLIAQTHQRSAILRVGGGPPGSTEFEVRLDDKPIIRAKKSAMPIIPPGKLTETNIEVPITDKELDNLYSLAILATDFGVKSKGLVADGTSAALTIKLDGKTIFRNCISSGSWPNGKKTKKFLKQINRHLPEAFQIF